jgi:hypothetical protein
MFTITWKRLAAASGVTAFVVLGSVGTAMIDPSASSSFQPMAAPRTGVTATGTNIHKPTDVPPGYGPSIHPGHPPCQQRRC